MKKVVKGNIIWKNEEKKEVEFIPDKDGKFKVYNDGDKTKRKTL